MTQAEPIHSVPHVDLQKYFGIWFEIVRKPMRHEDATARDITATYSLNEDKSVRVINACLNKHGHVEVSEGKATPVDTSNAKLEVSFLPEVLQWIPFSKGHYWVLKLDEQYTTALVGEPSRKYLWLLHREPKMLPAVRHEWIDFAVSIGYDISDLIFPEQSGLVHSKEK